jgi:hypothetical protein
MEVEIVSEMNPNYKIIKYKFMNLTPDSALNLEEFQTEFYMLVSYQMLGENNDKACMTMFEFDIQKFKINPLNFVIVSQKINKNASNKYLSFSSLNSAQHGVEFYKPDHAARMLSVVPEGNLDEEAGSASFRNKNLQSASKLNRRNLPQHHQTKQITIEDEQD